MNSTLLPPSSTAWMRSTEAATARLSGITVAIRTLWTPTTCPVDLLPYLAWALSVDRWDKDWPAERKIAVIQRSYWLHRRKGTRAAVRRVIEDMGFSATFAEWFDVGDQPGTFRLEVDVNEAGLTPKTLDELNRLIGDAKPVSRHLSQMIISTSARGTAWVGLAATEGETITVYPADYEPDDGVYYDGQQNFTGNVNFSGKQI
ncbi:phage tail protein I [Klebsiella quasipneumoniae subsp. similipneumoniae]|uniref:Phage tail protein I n=1 Tax=Klebsiella quasipneumoniae subsp. similipneumoniae TaxID=1463164 RepID=A0AAE4SJN7_9ENTR|nr:phage tail protein I [Klebsiella quasipneumoniae]HDY8871290.1 phage tail protein I [Klebsiella pneumoniae]MDV0614077.1 phage tail protein I [Klebsiella quasipneumoniae subsp. similipneumoniae]MDV0641807.1 phage tail protein I [Klebsiella quasipneumoniae subsp. similipneumoniae]MDV0728940.1 phage tail protein I [Klebsiella quasipneumoniae subsp. similipneumoniae]MDV0740368.1 phage tail protein I [Klebsiella quasipneumoniae subsp. similipneumoniae]